MIVLPVEADLPVETELRFLERSLLRVDSVDSARSSASSSSHWALRNLTKLIAASSSYNSKWQILCKVTKQLEEIHIVLCLYHFYDLSIVPLIHNKRVIYLFRSNSKEFKKQQTKAGKYAYIAIKCVCVNALNKKLIIQNHTNNFILCLSRLSYLVYADSKTRSFEKAN